MDIVLRMSKGKSENVEVDIPKVDPFGEAWRRPAFEDAKVDADERKAGRGQEVDYSAQKNLGRPIES